ncbi:calcium-activated chloride channel regulator 1-like isoform X2 [Sapajus apella]|uniref:Calcium-activated chloride channel regulator 1-like isoform X2 n=1 Tax=Sapajus apella TaxID=9515 RepID=A0A6J3JDL5_SAPAP|nr:calcium-activated chloride channel regulator 1-like isoform X2 [Sapajus apella]
MVFSLKVILFLSLLLLPVLKSSRVTLNNNGYDGIVIAINPSVPEDEKLIQNIKAMVTEASAYLFYATKRRVFFRNVSILIPMTWKSKPEYLMPKQESYDQADVIVAEPSLKYGDDPYTLQYGQCGEKGKYIHFTPNFLLTNNLPIYGTRGKVFVHEWSHLRWGIFDEYNEDQPFYISRRNTIEATRCPTHITGANVVLNCKKSRCITRPCRRDSKTGLYEANCTFIPNRSQTAKDSIMFMQNLDSEDRLFRMNQAAELYLIQIIEKGSFVGMVTFDSHAQIQNNLIKITDDNTYQMITANLPQEARGGTSICNGLKAGFQAISQSNQSTLGSEIILLTDGEDDQISSCFEEVKQSGAIIHTIALGPSAEKELETLSNMTRGHRFYAHNDINGLIDAFSRISSRSGSIFQQALQLESKALNIPEKKWVNGTVPVDSTVGNDTFFVVTWTIQKPEIILQGPKGKKFTTLDFQEDKLNIRSARLRIPGIAETGTWTYSLRNNHAQSQLLTVTMTTRARSPTTLPVIATAHMNRNTAHYPSPMIVYARVSQGFLPVLGINVTAIIENEDGRQVTLELWDNGAGADTVKNDGIYSRYFTDYHRNGRYSLKVHVQARKNTARLSLRQQQNKALYIPGYVENGKIILNPPKPEAKDDVAEAQIDDFSRLTSGESFIVSGVPPNSNSSQVFPPGKIVDLEAKFQGDHIQLSWTAPGKVLDKGRADSYIIRISKYFRDLQQDFDKAALINTSGLIPKEAGSVENFGFKPGYSKIENGTTFYIAIQATGEASLTSEVSNIAQATKFIPPPKPSSPDLGTNISAISFVIFGLAVISYIF